MTETRKKAWVKFKSMTWLHFSLSFLLSFFPSEPLALSFTSSSKQTLRILSWCFSHDASLLEIHLIQESLGKKPLALQVSVFSCCYDQLKVCFPLLSIIAVDMVMKSWRRSITKEWKKEECSPSTIKNGSKEEIHLKKCTYRWLTRETRGLIMATSFLLDFELLLSTSSNT